MAQDVTRAALRERQSLVYVGVTSLGTTAITIRELSA